MNLELIGMGRSHMVPTTPISSSSNVVGNTSFTSPVFLSPTTLGSQPTLESFNENMRKEANMIVRKFWYRDIFLFDYAKSIFYHPMVDAIASVGFG